MNVEPLAKLTKRRIDQIALAVTVLVTAGLVVAFLGTGVSALRHVTAQEETLDHRLAYLNEVATMFGEGEETLTFLQQRTQELNARLPMQVDYRSFYTELIGIASPAATT